MISCSAVACGLGAACAAAAGAIARRSARRGWSFCHPARTRVPASARPEAGLGDVEDVALRTADGLSLRGWFAPGDRRSVIVFVHGLWGNRLSLLPEARLLRRRGFGVLLFDSRASGESDGHLATWGDREQLDVRAAVDFVTARPDVAADGIVVYGFSVGASAAAMAVARDPRPRALILCAVWPSFADEIRDKFASFGPLSWGAAMLAMRRAGIDPDRIRPVDHLGAVSPRPLLLITGT
ncbi:MAG TPA: alpha/beta fold hydrolase, partial [Polyangiaceae bacterium]|nr:alpha/beta fold hydrolase [Polyangiaceae bacterium]